MTSTTKLSEPLSDALIRIKDARHHDPFEVLGLHSRGAREVIYAHLPYAKLVWVGAGKLPLQRIPDTDLFFLEGDAGFMPRPYLLHWEDREGQKHSSHDPYAFPPQLSEFDLHLFGQGNHWHIYRILGAHEHEVEGIKGVLFATWAPNAERISVVGDFNRWDGRSHPMRARGGSGIWELFIPEMPVGTLYKFEIRSRQHGQVLLKGDPYGQQYELRPRTASRTPRRSPLHLL